MMILWFLLLLFAVNTVQSISTIVAANISTISNLHPAVLSLSSTHSMSLSAQQVTFSNCSYFPSTEFSALYDLYNATNGMFWAWNSTRQSGAMWNFTGQQNPCTENWQGIECLYFDNICNIASIVLNDFNLNGQLPNTIDQFSYLTLFSVSRNQIYGTMPSQLCNVSNIFIDDNYFTGEIPNNFSSSLVLFEASNNLFSKSIPSSLGISQKLATINLNYNLLTGSIPPLRTLNNIEIYYGNNFLAGTFPEHFCNLTIVDLSITSNSLTGQLQTCFGNQSLLINLLMQNNLFSGTLDDAFSNLRSLSSLYANGNLLSGHTTFLVSLLDLQALYIQNNLLSGPVVLPNSTANNNQGITFVDISNNAFSGQLSSDLFIFAPFLQSFAASTNCISGSIPSNICELNHLQFLNLDGLSTASECRQRIFQMLPTFIITQLYGGIPNCLFQMPNLEVLHLSGNGLRSMLPHDLHISDSLFDISLSYNIITGEFVSSANHCFSLLLTSPFVVITFVQVRFHHQYLHIIGEHSIYP